MHHLDNPSGLYSDLMELIVQLGGYGLIHCDFNEFNVLLDSKDKPTVIDFPQMVSIMHLNAKWYVSLLSSCLWGGLLPESPHGVAITRTSYDMVQNYMRPLQCISPEWPHM